MAIFGLFGKKEQKTNGIASTSPLQFPSQEGKSIEARIKGKKATCDGLYPHEVLVLSYAPLYWTKGSVFPGFWSQKYGITDVQKILDSLYKRSYITEGSLLQAISKDTVANIKEALHELGIQATGKKEALIEALAEKAPKSALEKRYSRRLYQLTDKGKEVLQKYEYIPYIHSHENYEGLDIWMLDDLVHNSHRMKYRDVIWGYLNKRCMQHITHGDYGLYRNCKATMSHFLIEENKNEEAFQCLLEVVFLDLSGLPNGFRKEYIVYCSDVFFPYERSIAKVDSKSISEISKFQAMNAMSDKKLTAYLEKTFSKYKVPFQLFDNGECSEIVLAEIKGDQNTLDKIYTAAEKRFKKNIKSSSY